MQQAIQFDTVVDHGTIRIPEQFLKLVPRTVKVTLAPMKESKIIEGARSKAGNLSPGDFSAIKTEVANFKFDREEANARR